MKNKKRVIAIADDDRDELDLLTTAFEENHDSISILRFDRGADLITFLVEAPEIPDLVITDMYMPAFDGSELLAAMKGNPALAEIPVVILSTIKADLLTNHQTLIKNVFYFLKPTVVAGYATLTDDILVRIFGSQD